MSLKTGWKAFDDEYSESEDEEEVLKELDLELKQEEGEEDVRNCTHSTDQTVSCDSVCCKIGRTRVKSF